MCAVASLTHSTCYFVVRVSCLISLSSDEAFNTAGVPGGLGFSRTGGGCRRPKDGCLDNGGLGRRRWVGAVVDTRQAFGIWPYRGSQTLVGSTFMDCDALCNYYLHEPHIFSGALFVEYNFLIRAGWKKGFKVWELGTGYGGLTCGHSGVNEGARHFVQRV